jgi:hypothetical protein
VEAGIDRLAGSGRKKMSQFRPFAVVHGNERSNRSGSRPITPPGVLNRWASDSNRQYSIKCSQRPLVSNESISIDISRQNLNFPPICLNFVPKFEFEFRANILTFNFPPKFEFRANILTFNIPPKFEFHAKNFDRVAKFKFEFLR